MKQLLVFIRKEFYHVFRDRRTLLILFGLPVVQIILFGYALTSEIKNASIVIVDNARDINAQEIITKIQSGSYFKVERAIMGYPDIEKEFKKGTIKCAIVIPQNFGNDLLHSTKAEIQIIADGSDPNTSKTLINYLTVIISGYQQELNVNAALPYRIIPETRMLYNEEGNGSLNFVPGVIALIFLIVCTTLTSVSVVKEKEAGTMEVLLVSPFKPMLVLVAKAIPYLALSMINLVIILLLSVFLLGITIKGSIALLFLESILFVITCLSLGLVISNNTRSQQAAMMTSMMGMMLPTLLLSGFLFPLESMPWVLRAVSNVLPSRWYYNIMKAVMLKGLGIQYVWKDTLVLLGMTAGLLILALRNFKIRLE